jgi:hypothetical protein
VPQRIVSEDTGSMRLIASKLMRVSLLKQEWKDNFKLFCKVFSRMNHKVLELDPRNLKQRTLLNIKNEIKALKKLMKNEIKEKELIKQEIRNLL